MLYSILIYETPGLADARSAEERERTLVAHRKLQADTKRSGAFVAATQLAESGAMSARRRKEEVLVSDGPFPETKELFIGFYLFDCGDLEEAIELGKRIPVSESGGIEIRPVTWAETVDLVSG